jgi:long-chain acyl-CoA synthetase
MAVERLKQTLGHLRTVDSKPVASQDISLLHGPTEPALLQLTLSELLLQRANADPDREATVFPESNQRFTYQQLYDRSIKVAKGLMYSGIQGGDHVGILAGNCHQYVELFFATSHVGAALVVLNNTYTTSELRNAVKASCTSEMLKILFELLLICLGCKLVFISQYIGKTNNAKSLSMFKTDIGSADLPDLRNILLLKSAQEPEFSGFRTYEKMVAEAASVSTQDLIARIEAGQAHDICNLQFTSGTTGNPKAALLTHRYVFLR